MRKIKSKAGYTLVELIIIIGVAGIVLVPLTFLVTGSLRNANRTQRTIDAMQDAQRIFIVMNETFRSSDEGDIEFIEHSTDSDVPDDSLRIKGRIYFAKSNGFYYKDVSDPDVSKHYIHKMSDYVISHLYTFESGTYSIEGWIKLEIVLESEAGSGNTEKYETSFYKRQ